MSDLIEKDHRTIHELNGSPAMEIKYWEIVDVLEKAERSRGKWRSRCIERGEYIAQKDKRIAELERLKISLRAALTVWDMRVEEMRDDRECCQMIVAILKDAT